MIYLILEACFAFFIFAFIVWWTMFSGNKSDRRSSTVSRKEEDKAP